MTTDYLKMDEIVNCCCVCLVNSFFGDDYWLEGDISEGELVQQHLNEMKRIEVKIVKARHSWCVIQVILNTKQQCAVIALEKLNYESSPWIEKGAHHPDTKIKIFWKTVITEGY